MSASGSAGAAKGQGLINDGTPVAAADEKEQGTDETSNLAKELSFFKWAQYTQWKYWWVKYFGGGTDKKGLTKEKIAQINELRFDWGEVPDTVKFNSANKNRKEVKQFIATDGRIGWHDIHFLKQAQKLKMCKEKHGSCSDRNILKEMYPKDEGLNEWIRMVNRSYAEFKEGKKGTFLTQTLYDYLISIGVDFELLS